MIVTVARYQAITGDTTTAASAVSARLEDAQALVEEYLRRELESTERTETLQVWPGGLAYPSVTPVTAVPSASGHEVYDTATVGAVAPEAIAGWPIFDVRNNEFTNRASVTYTGGYTADTLPHTLERVIAELAEAMGGTSSSTLPGGAVQASVGDVALRFEEASAGGADDNTLASILAGADQQLKRYVRRHR